MIERGFAIKCLPKHIKTVVVVHDFDYVDGGAGKVAFEYAKDYADSGIETYLFTGTGDSDYPKIANIHYVSAKQKPTLTDSNKLRGAINGIYNFKAKRKLRELLSTLDPKSAVVHIHTWTKVLSSSIWNAAYSMHFPIYLTCHDYFTVCPNGGLYNYRANKICCNKPLSVKCLTCNCDSRNFSIKIYRFLRSFVQNNIVNIFRKTSKFISISDFSENILRNYFPKETVFERHFNPIDKLELTEKIDFTQNTGFLFVGRISKEKGCDIFCQAIYDCKLKGIVVGDGPELTYLKKKFADANIDFVGWKTRNEVFEYMKKARALIFPSRWYEAAPLTVPEAQSIGLPCIVSNSCAARDYIKTSKDGAIFDTPEDLKKCIARFCDK